MEWLTALQKEEENDIIAQGTRAIFQIQLPTKTSFTANANQSNESVTRARVASTDNCAWHGRKNWFLPPWKLVFTTMEIDYYHSGNWFLPPLKRKCLVSFDFITITTFNNKLMLCSKVIFNLFSLDKSYNLTDCWIFDLKVLHLWNSNLQTKSTDTLYTSKPTQSWQTLGI